VGNKVGIITTMAEKNPAAEPINFHVQTADLGIITPDGLDEMVPMTDSYEGLAKFNYDPNSGFYGAEFELDEPGTYLVQATIKGTMTSSSTGSAIPFERTSQHIVQASSATIELTGTSAVRTKDADHLYIDIGVTGTGDQLRAYAEVLGTDPQTKEFKPACWLGGIVAVENNAVTLVLDVNWLKLAGVSTPLKIENVYVADLTTSFPVSSSPEQMEVVGSEHLQIELTDSLITITEEMRFGVNPLPKLQANVTAGPTLCILPGYCSASNPWEKNTADFTNAALFHMKKQNLGHHAFAVQAIEYCEKTCSSSYSLLGHSQGGAVSTHISNFFFTGNDNCKNGRPIQSVGTPYSGCTAAGTLANLGEIFGVGCGSNNDLSLDGSKSWLTGISPAIASKVSFYSTSYEQGSWMGDYCNMAINLILQWPNDGTTEIQYCKLPGATYLGNTQKQCHTSDMKYAAQYTDSKRNQEINRLAAR